MTPDELGRFSIGRSRADWSAAPSTHAASDADRRALDQLRTWLRASAEPSRHELAVLQDLDLLRALGLADADARMNRAGELLVVSFADREPLIDLVCRPAPGADTTYRPELAGLPLATALATVEAGVQARNPRKPAPAGFAIGQLPALPDLALREAILNAVMHRDYALPGPVRVTLEGTTLTVTSPGGFLPGISPETVITAPAKARNPRLADALRSLRLAEAEGIGVDRMFRETIRIGIQAPCIDEVSDGSAVRCVLIGGDADPRVIRVVSSLGDPAAQDVDVLLVLATLEQRPTVTATLLAPIIQKTRAEATAAIQRALAVGLVTGTSRDGHYRLTDRHRAELAGRLSYLRRSREDYDEVLELLLQDSGRIRARDVIEVCSVSPVTASRILAAAVERGVLIKCPTPDARGAGVYYTAPE